MKWDFPNSPYWEYTQAMEALQKEYDAERDFLKQKLKEAQKKCQHKKTTYYPDPSDNNDSFTECDECGALS